MRYGGGHAHALRLAACAATAWLVWLLWHLTGAEAGTVSWTCDGVGTCGSNDFASFSALPGTAATLLLGVLCARYLHRATPGLVVLLAVLACADGFQRALDEGTQRAGTVPGGSPVLIPIPLTTGTWLTVLHVLAVLACAAAAWGAVFSARRLALLPLLRGSRARAAAELNGWRPRGRRHAETSAVFRDADGTPHEVMVRVERAALRRPVEVRYDPERPGDPDRTRAFLPRKSLVTRP
ncbi:hypothetical protein [Streptomyces sp. SPB074]|uniref:hypothetical protein n=1 Tax=Streptomyces sp. (strain SPB074) TaxID=465543 RepID=UPI0001D1E0F5|nr:hypothetical protein [Streptomyces sp. SPB074]EFG64407.1 protoporphyrinogen oxidase [Streptomyces sp. SPB074]